MRTVRRNVVAADDATPLLPPSSTWHSAALDEIEDDIQAICEAQHPLWRPARRGGATTMLVACALRELAGLHARKVTIEGEPGP